MIRVCQLITELRPAGAEKCVYELATRLDRAKFEVLVAALRGGAVADALTRAGVPVHVLGVASKAGAIAYLPRLARWLKGQRVDLLHTHLFHADLIGRPAGRLAGVPHLVHTVHTAERRVRPLRYVWARLADRWCDRILCVSSAVRDLHARKSHLPASRYEVIYNGVDLATYARDARRRDELRRQWGIAPGDVLLAYAGRLDPEKNVPLILAAARRLREEGLPVRLILAGDGADRPAVERFLAANNNASWARWLGFSNDVPGLLSAADLFVQPSRWEGFGLAAAEAMAAGLPVVATRVPGLAELVDDGVTGLLVESDDADLLAAAIRRLILDADFRAQLGTAAVERVRQHFAIESFIAAHERVYEAVCHP